jgi:transcription termination factor NusB
MELAKKFAGEGSLAFINGVLDAVHRDLSPPPVQNQVD